MRIVVCGARGQLGAAVVHHCSRTHDVIALGHDDLDVTDDAAVAAALDRAAPDAVINCTAYNDVDGAEDHPIEALSVNALAVRPLVRAVRDRGAALVHYSTDFIFDGTASQPYREDDRPNPLGVYAATKLIGEWFANDAPRAYVLRVESLFGRAPDGRERGSVAAILKTMKAGGEVRVFEDRTVSPTYVVDAACATEQLLARRAPPGLYHCVNSGRCTWLELAHELARQLGVEPRLIPVRMADVPLRARRPQYCALNNQKLNSAGVSMPPWQDALARYVRALST